MTITYPQPLKFHKKVAQLQADLVRPKEETDEQGKKRIKDGCIFLSLAKALGDNSGRMDWTNQLRMKISPTDICNILVPIRAGETAKLFHKSEAAGTTSTLEIAPGERAGTFKWFISNSKGADKKFGNIYLDNKDMFYLFKMFESALPVINGWN